MTARRYHRSTLAVALLVFGYASAAGAQSLRGSKASIDRMYHHALDEKLPFYETPSGVRAAVSNGRLVKLTPDAAMTLHEVGYPYVRPSTRLFVDRLSQQ